MKRAILIPVKDLSVAKQRLAPQFSQAERTALAEAMMHDVFAAVERVRIADAVFVVSSDEQAAKQAERRGWGVIREATQISESASVDAASQTIGAKGFGAVLRLPIDIPLVQPQDIDELLEAEGNGAMCILVPSRDGTGTNALLRTPPELFPSRFGPHSWTRHFAEARARNAEIRVLRNARIELDLDDADDVRHFLTTNGGGAAHTRRWLAEHAVRMTQAR